MNNPYPYLFLLIGVFCVAYGMYRVGEAVGKETMRQEYTDAVAPVLKDLAGDSPEGT